MSLGAQSLRFRPLPPAKSALWLSGAGIAALAARVAGFEASQLLTAVMILLALAAVALVVDFALTRRALGATEFGFDRHLPAAFALGVSTTIEVRLSQRGHGTVWRGLLYDQPNALLEVEGLPVAFKLGLDSTVECSFRVCAAQRGDAAFAPALLRLRSRLGLFDLDMHCGREQTRRVFPNFMALSRYAWLGGNRHLNQAGLKAVRQRGTGTDFKQLSDYQAGDPVRYIDWRASQRRRRPVVKEFQDERDQRVMLLLDCGRRMRADDRDSQRLFSHFDQVLNAALLLAYVALRHGDYVGAMTFGHAEGQGRAVAPARGAGTLQHIMSELYAVQPSLEQSDYLVAARDLMERQQKRALVILVTNFRDEDESDLRQALRLLRSRHLVILASLEEQVVGELIAQPLSNAEAVLDVAGAHYYRQARSEAFRRLVGNDVHMFDTEPTTLGVNLVNRYNAIKRAGLL